MRYGIRMNAEAILNEKLFITRENFTDAVLQGNTADQVVLFHTAQTGIKKDLFHVLLHALRLSQNLSQHILLDKAGIFTRFR